MRVVLDTNVFINGLFKNDDFCKALFRLKNLNKITFVMNKEMQAELLFTFYNILLEAFKRKRSKNGELQVLPLAATLSKCLWQVEEIDHIMYTNYCEEDKSDNKFIDCCIDGNVKYLIIQDMHINSVSNRLEKERKIKILSPMQFYTSFQNHMLD